MKRIIGILIAVVILQTSCRDDEGNNPGGFPPIDRGSIEANRLEIIFNRKNDPNNTITFEYYDPDGIAGNSPTVNERINLDRPIVGDFLTYEANIKIYQDDKDVTNDIMNLGTSYVLCYRRLDSRNFRLADRDLDSQGRALGLSADFVTVDESGDRNPTDGSGILQITLNFQKEKDGTCDAGIRILEASMNYQLN